LSAGNRHIVQTEGPFEAEFSNVGGGEIVGGGSLKTRVGDRDSEIRSEGGALEEVFVETGPRAS